MAVPYEKYAPLTTIHGRRLGLDAGGDKAAYLVGAGLYGLRIGMNQGADYKVSSPIRHNDYFDDFIGPTLDSTTWTAQKGSDGSGVAPIINLQVGGVVRGTTGAGSTHTMAVNGTQIVGSRNFLVSNDGLRFETRIKVSALTSQSFCFGLIDAVTLTAPFTRTTVTTTANGTNGACFLQDAASTNTHLYAVAVNAGGSPQSVALNVDLDTAAFHIYRIEIDGAGNAQYFIDGLLVATIALAVATTSQLAMSVGAFSEATSGGQTFDVDYLLGQQVRV